MRISIGDKDEWWWTMIFWGWMVWDNTMLPSADPTPDAYGTHQDRPATDCTTKSKALCWILLVPSCPNLAHPTIFIKLWIGGSLPWTLQNKGISSQVYLLSTSRTSRAAVTNFLWRLLFFDNTLEAVIAHGFANQPNSRVTQRQQRVVRSFARNASAPRYPRIGSGLCQTKEDKLFDQKQL